MVSTMRDNNLTDTQSIHTQHKPHIAKYDYLTGPLPSKAISDHTKTVPEVITGRVRWSFR